MALTAPAAGQAIGEGVVQIGAGAIPGLGVQAGYIQLRSIYTVEGVLYVDGSPPVFGGQGQINASAGLGGAVRIFAVPRIIGNTGYTGYDLDFGIRFGPGLAFRLDETKADRNQRFNLFADPYLRFTSTFRDGRVFFVEAGLHRPLLRGGLWLSF